MVVNYFEALLNEESNKINIIKYYSLWINLQKIEIESFQEK